jgi:hypothetical protein
VEKLKKLFKAMDGNHNGKLATNEVKAYLNRHTMMLKNDEALKHLTLQISQRIFAGMDESDWLIIAKPMYYARLEETLWKHKHEKDPNAVRHKKESTTSTPSAAAAAGQAAAPHHQPPTLVMEIQTEKKVTTFKPPRRRLCWCLCHIQFPPPPLPR